MPDQVEAEPVEKPATFDWLGGTFGMADRIGRMPALRFADVANREVDSSDMEGMAAMYRLLKACIHPSDWQRFNDHADATAASDEDLWQAILLILAGQASRPTSRPSDSSDGPSATEPSSTSTPAGRAIARLNGRPDLQLAVVRAAEAQGMAV